jgi:hypothetical protein
VERDLAALAPGLRVSATAGWQHVAFADADDGLFQTGADLVYDTRLDPILARNAVYARARWERTKTGDTPLFPAEAVNQTTIDVSGYLGLIGQNVLVVRGVRIPLSSPIGTGKFGLSAFVDVGSAYDVGGRLRDQILRRAVGGGVWFSAAFVHLNLAVARGLRGPRGSTRLHFGAGVSP